MRGERPLGVAGQCRHGFWDCNDPLAAQLAIYLEFVHYRLLGATLVGIAFIIPSFLIVVALGWAYVRFGGLSWMQAVFYGVGAAVIGIMVMSARKLTEKSVGKDKLLCVNAPLLTRLLWVKGLRAFADGYVSLLLPLYLTTLGMSPFQVGAIATGTLLGSGLLTVAAGVHAWRFQYRSLLLAASLLMAATGFCFAAAVSFWPLLVCAIVGTLNPSSGDVSVFLPLEHSVMSRAVEDERRTALFARYSLIGSVLAAFGALSIGFPGWLTTSLGVSRQAALQAMFALYGLLGLAAALIYATLPRQAAPEIRLRAAPLRASRKTVYTLAALFSLDAFGGGLVVQSMLALWLFQKFQLSLLATGTIFFWTGVCSACSYLLAAPIAERFGLVNTMVFTHLPANILLVLVPLMPTLGWAIALLVARSALSQMDVPTRSSYVMAVVPPDERAAAASITAVPRSFASAASPLLAGVLLDASAFGWPVMLAGAVKIAYDLLLLLMFRNVLPPEEAGRNPENI